jgi:hypothetical protein
MMATVLRAASTGFDQTVKKPGMDQHYKRRVTQLKFKEINDEIRSPIGIMIMLIARGIELHTTLQLSS